MRQFPWNTWTGQMWRPVWFGRKADSKRIDGPRATVDRTKKEYFVFNINSFAQVSPARQERRQSGLSGRQWTKRRKAARRRG